MKRSRFFFLAAFARLEFLILVALAGAIAAFVFVNSRTCVGYKWSPVKETANRITDISRSLEEYRLDRGSYPRPADEAEETVIDDQSYKIGGARMLYQILSGDGTDAIKGGNKASTGVQGSAQDPKDSGAGKIYMDSVAAPTPQNVKDKKYTRQVEADADGHFYLVDAWHHPIQYQAPASANEDTGSTPGHPAFKMWSYGKLKKPGDSAEARQEWIANWFPL